MKKILFTIFSLFLLVSCNQDEIELPTPLQGDEEAVTLTFSVNVPQIQSVTSRGLGETATLRNLHVIVFDEKGNFIQKATAEYLSVNNETTNDNKNEVTEFTVTLAPTAQPRILHFVGNADVSSITYGSSELDLSHLKVSLNDGTGEYDHGAYWQRVEFPNGISEAEMSGRMQPVYLVRNFSKISVSVSSEIEKPDNITYESFAVINIENTGSVAPYYHNSETSELAFAQYTEMYDNGKFVIDETTQLAKKYGYSNLINIQKFKGYVPGTSTTIHTKDKLTTSSDGGLTFGNSSFYLYERTHNELAPTFVIVKARMTVTEGTTQKDTYTYYRIDLITDDVPAVHYHILRNFAYNIKIEKIAGEGYSSAYEAANKPAGNNIFASTELKDLTNISDGTGRLFVNYTNRTLVSNKPVTLEYMYIPDITSNASENSAVRFSFGTGNVIASHTATSPDHTGKNVENEGYSSITITPNSPSNSTERQEVTLYVAGGLQRTVTYTLKPYYEFVNVTATNPSTNTVGSPFEFKFELPDGMDESLFPMTFLVEAYPQTIYPNTDDGNDTNDLPDYASMPATTLDQSFGYERTVTWEDYEANRNIVCGFKINTPNYATVISVSHELFKTGLTNIGDVALVGTFSNLTINGVTTGATVPYGIGQDVVVTFDMSLVDPTTLVKITAANMASASSSTGFIEKNADGTFTYTPTRKAGKQTITFKTGTIVSANTVTGNYEFIIQGAEGNTKYGETNILNGDFTNVFFVSQNDLYATLAVSGMSIYTDANYTNQLGQSTYDFTANGNYLTTDISSSTYVPSINGSLYFKNSDGSRKASITIAQLLDNSHPDELVISDADGTRINEFSNLRFDNDDRYGIRQQVAIKFNMSSTDRIEVKVEEGNNIMRIPYTPQRSGEQTVYYETKTWSDNMTVTLTDGEEYDYGYTDLYRTTATRNKLVIPAGKLQQSATDETIRISTDSGKNTNGTTIEISSNSDQIIEMDGLQEDTLLYFKYSQWIYVGTIYYISSAYTASNLSDTTGETITLTFTRQQ